MLSYNWSRLSRAIMQRFLGAILAASVLLGSPLHCLAKGLHKPAPGAAASSRDLDDASHSPQIRCISHCASHVALLPSVNFENLFNREQLRGGTFIGAWMRPGDLLLQTQILVRDIGPPAPSAVLARQNLPLLI